MELSLLDLSLYTNGSPNECQILFEQVLLSCASSGFVKFVNHGIPDEKISEAFEWSRRFFTLSDAAKSKAARPSRLGPNRGWASIGQEKISKITGVIKGETSSVAIEDMKESFDLGPHDDPIFPTPWPAESDIPYFKSFMQSFYDDCHEVHMLILQILEKSLGLEKGRLSSLCGDGNAELRIAHYPPIEIRSITSGKVMRIAEHTDVGTVTLLFQDSVGGLEVENQKRPGTFIPIHSSSTSEMIVNIGDTLQRWTNEVLCSANHRVTIPVNMQHLSDGLISARISIGYFGKANRDISLRPLTEFEGNGGSRFNDEIQSQDYYTGIHERSYPAPELLT